MFKRNAYKKIWDKLSSYKNMVFVAGPRQTGKSTFALMLAEDFASSLYFNWDIVQDKQKLITNPSFFEEINRADDSNPLIILDEIHKYESWKNYLKGVYDKFHNDYKFLVSGSGRLDVFQRGGDSLAGRYLLFHIWPFTLSEISNKNLSFQDFVSNPLSLGKDDNEDYQIWENLNKFSGFPEPFLKGEEAFYQLWSTNYQKQLLREDIRNFFQAKNADKMEILFSLLPDKIGSLLSINNLSQTIQVSFESVKNWLDLFEHFFLVFRIAPWKKSVSRAIIKEKKLYLFDYAHIENESARFENMVAVELLRGVSNWNALGLGSFSLNFIRNKEKEEVDFLIVKNNNPFLLIECKLSNTNIPKSLIKFQNSFQIPAVQLVSTKNICKLISNGDQKILVISAARWLAMLP